MIRVIVVDDELPALKRTGALLETFEDVQICGSFHKSQEFLEHALTTPEQIDLVLLDIVLTDTDGFEVAERLAEEPDAPAVVLVSSREASDFGRRLARSPVRGFLHKDDLSGAALAVLAAELR